MKALVHSALLAITAILIASASTTYRPASKGFPGGSAGTGTGTQGVGTIGSGTGSTGTGTGSGTGGTGTGGPPPGNQPWYPLMRVERAEEFKAQTSYTVSAGTTQTLSNQHVARFVLQVGGPPPSPPGSTVVVVNGTPTTVPWVLDGYSYSVGAVSPAQMGAVISGGSIQPAATTTIPTPSGGYATGLSVALTAYGEVPIQVSAPGVFNPLVNSSFQVVVGYHLAAHYVNPNNGQSVPENQTTYYQYTFSLTELLLNGSAIDTRRAFGQPNLAGELPADPNAPALNVVFTSWIYRGGCFVGSMPVGTTADESGLSRMQFWGSGPGVGTCLAATATLLDMGSRPTPTGTETVGVYIPASGDPNLNAGPSNLSWGTGWTSISPSASRGTPVSYAQTPVSTLALSSTNTSDYLNWFIADQGGGGYVIPSSVFTTLCFALTDETTGPSWHYFADLPYKSIATTFPGTDSQPRLWWVGLTGQSTTYYGPY